MKKWLLGKSLEELKEVVVSLSLPQFTAKQLADWIYIAEFQDIFRFRAQLLFLH